MTRLLVFASGTPEGGGSGFENLVSASRDGRLSADIAGVVSNHERGGVRERADRLGIPFMFFKGPFEAEEYARIVEDARADFVALSGWLKLVKGLDPKSAINIHPGPLPEFGGPGLWGHFVHEAVIAAYREGRVTHSAVSLHFVTEHFDEGPVFFARSVEIRPEDTAESLGARVNEAEHEWQPYATDLVVRGAVSWDGVNPSSLRGADVEKR